MMLRFDIRLILASAVLTLIALGCTINPVTGKQQLDLMGESQELALGAQLYPTYTQMSLGEVEDPRLQAWIEAIGQDLAAVSHRPQVPWEFNVVNEPAVNAYALPGGKISFTRGLLSRLESTDAVAAILGHEVGHVTARHSAVHYTRGVFAQLALGLGMVYMEAEETKGRQYIAVAGMIGAQGILARYGREQERQSDELGFGYMVSAGRNPVGMVETMEVLSSLSQRQPNLIERMFASHPQGSERLESATARLAEQSADIRNRPRDTAGFADQTAALRRQQDAYDRLDRGRRELGAGQAAKALETLRPAVGEFPDEGLLRTFLATARLEQNQTQRALGDATRAATDSPSIFLPQIVAAQALIANKRFRPALSHLDRAAAMVADTAGEYLLRAQAHEGLGEKEPARQSYLKVKELAPVDSEAAAEADRGLSRLGLGNTRPPNNLSR